MGQAWGAGTGSAGSEPLGGVPVGADPGSFGSASMEYVGERPISDRPASDRPASRESVGERPISDRPASDRSASAVPVLLSTMSVFPERTPAAFEAAARLGYDGVEVMVTADPVSQDPDVLRRLADYHDVPVLAVHAPCLLITQRVWGTDPWGKLVKTAEVADRLGARVIVVHPPFIWQREYARDFEAGLAMMNSETDITFTIENLYSLRAGGAEVAAWAPHWNPVEMDYPHATLDLSHTAVSGSDALEMADQLGGRLAHVHLADGIRPGLPDEHLVPGRGSQPCAQLLERLPAMGFTGMVVLEVNTRRALTSEERYADLAESLAFARSHLAAAAPAGSAARVS